MSMQSSEGDYTMFVPPCGKSFEDNIQFALYYCPADWKRPKATHLGLYTQKRVHWIGRIVKIVACSVHPRRGIVTDLEPNIVLTSRETQRIVGATQAAVKRRWDIQQGHQFILCDRLDQTDFCKISRGGMRSRRYFDLARVLRGHVPVDLEDLAEALRHVAWK